MYVGALGEGFLFNWFRQRRKPDLASTSCIAFRFYNLYNKKRIVESKGGSSISMHITKAEMEIMQVIWESGRRMSTKEIAEKLPDKKTTTILTLAGRLLEKGALHSVKLGRAHAYEYWAAISEQEYQKMQTQDFVRSIHKGSAKSLISALFQDEKLTSEDIEELREFIKRKADEHD